MSISGPHSDPFLCRVRRENQGSRHRRVGRYIGDDDVDFGASPAGILMERPPGFLEAHFLDVLVGTLNERLNVLHGPDRVGHDGLVRTGQRFSINISQDGELENQGQE